jgi:F0F1-type ATP synthase assembly protein I
MFPLAIAIGFGWGWWMDGVFGTWPWLSVIFTGFGVVAAFLNLFRFAAKSDKQE